MQGPGSDRAPQPMDHRTSASPDIDDNYIRGYFDPEVEPVRPAISKRKSVVSLSNKSLMLPDLISNTKATTCVSLQDGVSVMTMDDQAGSSVEPLLDHLQFPPENALYDVVSSTTSRSAPTLHIHSDSDDDMGNTLDKLIQDERSILRESFHSMADDESVDAMDDFDQVSQHEFADSSDDPDRFLHSTKQFLILSSAGKPIYSMHGSIEVVSGYAGIIQTIMSYFRENDDDNLKSVVTSSGTRFCFYNQSPIILLAISSKDESDLQLLQQLQFLYNFLLVTLSKPHISRVFSRRENYDLRKLLGRSDIACLDSICNDLSNGTNPGFIIGGLEAIKLKLPIRRALDDILLANRSPNLLYGLVVAPKGRLLTVLRPKRHTLHISDLQLLFEMIFNTNTFKSNAETGYSEEEFWVPTCLPKFNTNGFLYSFIKFVDLQGYCDGDTRDYVSSLGLSASDIDSNKIAVILISADKSTFFEMRVAANNVVQSLVSQRPVLDELVRCLFSESSKVRVNVDVPTPLVRHFAYKSKNHVQYVFPAIKKAESQAKLMHIYKKLQTLVLSHYSHKGSKSNFISYLKFRLSGNRTVLGLVLVTNSYELYVVTNDGIINKETLMKSCKRIIRWCMKNQERLFVCGGAVF